MATYNLDPFLSAYDPEAFRSLGHRVVDTLAEHLGGVQRREGPVLPWREPQDALADWPADFTAAGGAALEVITGGNAPGELDACAALAVKFGLTASIGSDFHNPQLPWNTLGRLAKLPDCVTPVWRAHGL